MDVTPQMFASVRKGRMTVPLEAMTDLAQVAGLPWDSIATVHSAGDKLHRIVGPAIRQNDQWAWPVFPFFPDPATGLSEYENEAEKLRKAWGLNLADA